MPAKHTQKIRAMDSGVLLTAYERTGRASYEKSGNFSWDWLFFMVTFEWHFGN
jgi:hypothetical protein